MMLERVHACFHTADSIAHAMICLSSATSLEHAILLAQCCHYIQLHTALDLPICVIPTAADSISKTLAAAQSRSPVPELLLAISNLFWV